MSGQERPAQPKKLRDDKGTRYPVACPHCDKTFLTPYVAYPGTAQGQDVEGLLNRLKRNFKKASVDITCDGEEEAPVKNNWGEYVPTDKILAALRSAKEKP